MKAIEEMKHFPAIDLSPEKFSKIRGAVPFKAKAETQ